MSTLTDSIFASLPPILTDTSTLLWHTPREVIEKRLPRPAATFDYTIGMTTDETALICGLIRKNKPRKILEVGVNKGGTTAVLLTALELLSAESELHSVDIFDNTEEILGKIPDITHRLNLHCGRDISAYLEDIGDDIDFCILDTSHVLPGEVLNFLCILPYLKIGATVVIHDQTHQFDVDSPYVRHMGSNSIISCRLLNDLVVAKKTTPAMLDPDGRWSAPNISSFTVSEQTIGNAGNILSALMLPWKSMPGIDHLTDALAAIRRKYPGHFAEYFEGVIRKQVSYHLSLEEKTHQYWGLTMLALKQSVGLERVAFFGAGSYCNDLVTRTIPRDLWPALVIDTFPENKKIATLPVMGWQEALALSSPPVAIVITSNAHHQSIESQLLDAKDHGPEIHNPFVRPVFSTSTICSPQDARYATPLW